MESGTIKLHLFCIPKKELKTYELGFGFLSGMGFYHVENRFYVGGGANWSKYFSHFRVIMP